MYHFSMSQNDCHNDVIWSPHFRRNQNQNIIKTDVAMTVTEVNSELCRKCVGVLNPLVSCVTDTCSTAKVTLGRRESPKWPELRTQGT